MTGPGTDAEVEARRAMMFGYHFASCPAHPDRVRNKGECTCPAAADADEWIAVVRAAERRAVLAECVVCGKRQPDDGYAGDALCYGSDGKSEPHIYEPRERAKPLADVPPGGAGGRAASVRTPAAEPYRCPGSRQGARCGTRLFDLDRRALEHVPAGMLVIAIRCPSCNERVEVRGNGALVAVD